MIQSKHKWSQDTALRNIRCTDVLPDTTFPKAVQQQYVGEVGNSIIVMLQINSVHRVPNIIEIGQHL